MRYTQVAALNNAIDILAGRFRIFARAQERAIEARAAARKLRSLLFASVSHDLRSPLNSILGFAGLVRQKPLSARSARKPRLHRAERARASRAHRNHPRHGQDRGRPHDAGADPRFAGRRRGRSDAPQPACSPPRDRSSSRSTSPTAYRASSATKAASRKPSPPSSGTRPATASPSSPPTAPSARSTSR